MDVAREMTMNQVQDIKADHDESTTKDDNAKDMKMGETLKEGADSEDAITGSVLIDMIQVARDMAMKDVDRKHIHIKDDYDETTTKVGGQDLRTATNVADDTEEMLKDCTTSDSVLIDTDTTITTEAIPSHTTDSATVKDGHNDDVSRFISMVNSSLIETLDMLDEKTLNDMVAKVEGEKEDVIDSSSQTAEEKSLNDMVAKVEVDQEDSFTPSKAMVDFGPSPGCFNRIGRQLYNESNLESLHPVEDTTSMDCPDDMQGAESEPCKKAEDCQHEEKKNFPFMKVVSVLFCIVGITMKLFSFSTNNSMDVDESCQCNEEHQEDEPICIIHMEDSFVWNETTYEEPTSDTTTTSSSMILPSLFLFTVFVMMMTKVVTSLTTSKGRTCAKRIYKTPSKVKTTGQSKSLLSPRELLSLDKKSIFASRFSFAIITRKGELKTVVRSARLSPMKM